MEAINVRLPAETPDALRIVRFWGERRLQGFADTGVFSISTGGQQNTATDKPEPARCDDDGLDSTIIEFDGSLGIASHEYGDDQGGHPYDIGFSASYRRHLR
jgi:hypothetical protein